jgi:hypothetical protein
MQPKHRKQLLTDIVEVLDGKTADWMKKLRANTIKPDHD